jgi:PAS domain S-box-containing protein
MKRTSDNLKSESNNPSVGGKLLEERLRFEELTVDILKNLININPAKLDKAVAESLRLLCLFFKVEYCCLLKVASDTRQIKVLLVGSAEGKRRNISDTDLVPIYPRIYDLTVEQKEPIIVLPMKNIPSSANPGTGEWHLWNSLNFRILPLKIDGKVTHAIGLWLKNNVWNWSPMYTDRLHLFGELFVKVLSHKSDYEALKENERVLSETERIGNLGSWNWNLETGELSWSDEVYRIFGLERQDFDGTYQFFLALIHPDDRQAVEQATDQSLNDTKKQYSIEHRLIRPDGSERSVYERGEVMVDEKGKPKRMFGTVLDITERKQSESMLQKAFEEISWHRKQLEAENIYLRHEIGVGGGFANIVGTSQGIQHIMFRIRQVAHMNTTVLITGETGTGKGIFARALHDSSNRKGEPFVQVNCAGLPANLIESELFGREKGAFTGATEKQIGRFELANRGTIFLDEIGELPIELQPKLLRVIESGEFERLGSPRSVKVDVRIIASTNRNLYDQIKKGHFRRDLFYRLNVFPIQIPPLRERREDVPLLVNYYVDKFNKRCNKNITIIPRETMANLQAYNWPGNVRELINVIERAVIVSNNSVLHITGTLDITASDKSQEITHLPDTEQSADSLAEVQRQHILEILMRTGWKIEGSGGGAEFLGMKPSTLRARMKKLNITRP